MTDVVDLIMNDHRELERIFDELLNEPAKRPNPLPLIATLLTPPSPAEEAQVYPKALEAGGAEDVQHSQKEHLEADELAEQLCRIDPASADFEPALQKLVDAVKHHVGEEEEKVLPGMRERMDAATLESLGEAFLASRAEHLGEQPTDKTKQEMQQQAANAGIAGASQQSKEELQQTLAQNADL